MRLRGAVGLLGGNEMRAESLPFDRALLEAAGNPGQVVIVPTALVRNGNIAAAMRQARAYFGRLGAEAVHVELHRRSDASAPGVVNQLRGSPLTYLLGGDPGYLLDTLRGSPAWAAALEAVVDGGAIAGSSAGAMVVAQTLLLRSRNPSPEARHGREALGLLPGVVVIPHLNAFGEGWLQAARREAANQDVLGLDESTGVVWSGGGWTVSGSGEAKLWRRGGPQPIIRRGGERLRWRAPRPA